jgi:hypothetical protein
MSIIHSGLSDLVRPHHKDTPLKFSESYVLCCCPWPETIQLCWKKKSPRLISRPSFNLTEFGEKEKEKKIRTGPSSSALSS